MRNLLTDKAKYDYLLFLDCDVQIGDNFIKKYIDFKNESEVIVGGVQSYCLLLLLHIEIITD